MTDNSGPPNYSKTELEMIGMWLFAQKHRREHEAKTIEYGDNFAALNKKMETAHDLHRAASVINELIESVETQISQSSS